MKFYKPGPGPPLQIVLDERRVWEEEALLPEPLIRCVLGHWIQVLAARLLLGSSHRLVVLE